MKKSNYWKSILFAFPLLMMGCSDQDDPGAEETALLDVAVNEFFGYEEEADASYLLISDQDGKVLAASTVKLGDQLSFKAPADFTEDKVNVTLLFKAEYEEDNWTEIGAISFTGIKKGSQWVIPAKYPYEEAEPVGSAQVSFANVPQDSYTDASFSMLKGYHFLYETGFQDIVQVPLYKTPTPVFTYVDKGDDNTYYHLRKEVSSSDAYTIDINNVEQMQVKTYPAPVTDYEYMQVRVSRAYMEEDQYMEENAIRMWHSSGLNEDGMLTLEYPGDAFPAYGVAVDYEKDDSYYYTTLKGPIPDELPIMHRDFQLKEASPGTFSMETQGDKFDMYFGEWEYYSEEEGNDVQWKVMGSDNNFNFPVLPDTLANKLVDFDIKDVILEDIYFTDYNNVEGYDDFLAQYMMKGLDALEDESTLTKEAGFENETAENARHIQKNERKKGEHFSLIKRHQEKYPDHFKK